MKILLRKSVTTILIFNLVLFTFLFLPLIQKTKAANFITMSDTLSRQADGENANHTIQFDLVTTWDAGETITIDFVDGDGWDTTGFANTEAEDYDITWEGAEKTIVANGSCAANSIEITTVNTTTDTFTFTLCATSTSSAATDTIVIEIGTHATANGSGDDQINNATSAGSKIITLGGTINDSGTLAVPILGDDQVVVSATVDPTITSTLSANVCNLGTLTASAINTCNYTNTVSTNASSGYVARLVDLSTTTAGKLCSPSAVTCTNDINRTTGNVDLGSEEYGVATDRAGQDLTDYGTGAGECSTPDNPQEATALSNTQTPQSYGNATGPVSSEVSRLCHAASIAGSTPAGSYTGTVTHITTGTF